MNEYFLRMSIEELEFILMNELKSDKDNQGAL